MRATIVRFRTLITTFGLIALYRHLARNHKIIYMSKKGTILVIDDEEDILFSLKFLLKQHFASVFTEHNPYHLPRLLRLHEPDVVLLDMNFGKGRDSGKEGIEWLQKVKEIMPQVPVVTMTAYSDVQIAVEALKSGATDFVEKPWRNEKMVATIKAAFDRSQTEKKLGQVEGSRRTLSQVMEKGYTDIIGSSPKMQAVFKTIKKVAATDANVLILGENGTGKELVARSLHRQSSRSDQVFIPVDLGSVSESLFESEIFGHKKGSFTGAHQDRIGRFQAASYGTLFLDEIGNIPMASQAKLLHALQTLEIVPVGSNNPVKVDIRLICATNMPLYDMVKESTFRQDLLYRINTVEIKLPALRERQGDIPLLAEFYLEAFRKKYHKPDLNLDEDCMEKLDAYHWPGNVRELRHIMERAVIMAEDKSIKPMDIVLSSGSEQSSVPFEENLTIDEVEERLIRMALKKNQGNISKAASELGLTRTSLYRRLQKYGI